MNKGIAILTGAVLLGAASLLIFNGSKTARIITLGTYAVKGIFQKAQTGSGIYWLVAYGATWLILIFIADAGADELATALAGSMFVAVLYAQIDNLRLGTNLSALGLAA